MTDQRPDVKDPKDSRSRLTKLADRVAHEFLVFVDNHPRCGWWWAVLLGLNTLLNFLDLFH